MQHKRFCTLTDDSELSISACNGSCILSQVNWAYKKLSQVFIYLVSTTCWPNIWRICKDECHRRILTTVSVYSMWNALTLDLHTIYNHYKLRSTTGPLAVLYQFSLLLYTPHKLLIAVKIHSSPLALCDQSDSSCGQNSVTEHTGPYFDHGLGSYFSCHHLLPAMKSATLHKLHQLVNTHWPAVARYWCNVGEGYKKKWVGVTHSLPITMPLSQ